MRHETHALEAIAETARELAGDDAAVTIPGPWTVEISAAGVSKAAARAELCSELGVAADEITASNADDGVAVVLERLAAE